MKNSKDIVGYQYPIKVAICHEDPNKDSLTSERRFHLRIIDGRHRYRQDPNWPREYYDCSSLDEYYEFRFNLDIKKKDNPKERKKTLVGYGKYLCDVEKIPLEKIGSTICKRLRGLHNMQILRYLPPEWKDSTKADNRLGKTKQKNGKNIHEKCLQEIEFLKTKLQHKEKDLENLRDDNKIKNETIETQKAEIKSTKEDLEKLKIGIKKKEEKIKELEKEKQSIEKHRDELFQQLWDLYNPKPKTIVN